jgi:Heterokaryon incompatibility protein (HET)
MSYAPSPYRYSSLWPGSNSIRLLRLMPHEDEAASIQCQLFNYSLQETGKGPHLYEALSYVWGDSNNLQSIYIDGHPFDTRENLHMALSHLRNHSFERILWVDAVCINQTDDQEKELQIQSMARIYGQAHSVIVWLGKMKENSDLALEEIRSNADRKVMNSSNNETIQQAILALLQRPWFERIWVRQQTINNIRRNY